MTIQLQHPEAIKVYDELNKEPIGLTAGNIETWQALRKNALEMIIAAWTKVESEPIFDPDAKF